MHFDWHTVGLIHVPRSATLKGRYVDLKNSNSKNVSIFTTLTRHKISDNEDLSLLIKLSSFHLCHTDVTGCQMYSLKAACVPKRPYSNLSCKLLYHNIKNFEAKLLCYSTNINKNDTTPQKTPQKSNTKNVWILVSSPPVSGLQAQRTKTCRTSSCLITVPSISFFFFLLPKSSWSKPCSEVEREREREKKTLSGDSGRRQDIRN